MWVEVLSVRAGVRGGGDHVSRSRGGCTGGDEREPASLSSVGDNAEDSVLLLYTCLGCVVKLWWSAWQRSGMCDEMLSRITADGIPHRCELVMCSMQHFFFCHYMRNRAHCKCMLDVCHFMKVTDGLMRDGHCISEELALFFCL